MVTCKYSGPSFLQKDRRKEILGYFPTGKEKKMQDLEVKETEETPGSFVLTKKMSYAAFPFCVEKGIEVFGLASVWIT